MARDLKAVLAPLNLHIEGDHSVTDLRLDSREVTEGDVFIALKGHHLDGHQFIDSALKQGASCVLVDKTYQAPHDMHTKLIGIENLSQRVAEIAAAFYGNPSQSTKLIGVTGTNGKSTTTAMIANLASLCGLKGSVVGTLGYGDTHSLTPLENTTPSHVSLQRILDELVKQRSEVIAIEVSSHGLEQGRVAHCDFEVGVFTNLSRDHLDYHGSMAEYANAKQKLFTCYKPRFQVLNVDDETTKEWLKMPELDQVILYGQKPDEHDFEHYVFFSDVKAHANGADVVFHTSWGTVDVSVPLYGLFNIYNLAAAFGTLLCQSVPLEKLAVATTQLIPVAGRMEAIHVDGFPTCIVDYAHTPEALELALQALQSHVPGKVTCVFGCGGDRDKGKRAMMAKAAEAFADTIVITSDNPRTEDPLAIISDIKAGLSKPEYAVCLEERAEAIRSAIQMTDSQGVVLIAGKGHEDYQIIGTQRFDFCDRRWVKEVLQGESA